MSDSIEKLVNGNCAGDGDDDAVTHLIRIVLNEEIKCELPVPMPVIIECNNGALEKQITIDININNDNRNDGNNSKNDDTSESEIEKLPAKMVISLHLCSKPRDDKFSVKNQTARKLIEIPMREQRLNAISVHPHDLYYNMRHKHRGCALIFNEKHFDSHLEMCVRNGTEIDARNLKSVLEQSKFKVTVIDDATHMEIFTAAYNLANQDHTDSDCILIIILSHGDFGRIFARDTYFHLDDLIDLFTVDKCPSNA